MKLLNYHVGLNFPLIPSHIGFPIPEYMTWFYKFPNPKNVIIYFMRKQKGEEISVCGVGQKGSRGTRTPSFLRNKYNKYNKETNITKAFH